jgi:hypothetical protein
MCFDHDEYAEVYRESTHRARKTYRCLECHLPIRPGEEYQSVFTVFEGHASTTRTCSVCEWFRERIANHEREEGCQGAEAYPAFGDLEQALETNEFSENGYSRLIGMVPLQRIGVGEDGTVEWSDYNYGGEG